MSMSLRKIIHTGPRGHPASISNTSTFDASDLTLRAGIAQCGSQALPTLLRLPSLSNQHIAARQDFDAKCSVADQIEEHRSMDMEKMCLNFGPIWCCSDGPVTVE